MVVICHWLYVAFPKFKHINLSKIIIIVPTCARNHGVGLNHPLDWPNSLRRAIHKSFVVGIKALTVIDWAIE